MKSEKNRNEEVENQIHLKNPKEDWQKKSWLAGFMALVEKYNHFKSLERNQRYIEYKRQYGLTEEDRKSPLEPGKHHLLFDKVRMTGREEGISTDGFYYVKAEYEVTYIDGSRRKFWNYLKPENMNEWTKPSGTSKVKKLSKVSS